jgi:hypothetical protein
MGLRSAYRVARVTSEIRDAGIDTSSPDGQTIPIDTADAIISRLDAAAPLPVPDVLKAQQTLQVFESVNARPPDLLATLLLGGVYGGSIVVAMIFFVVFAIAQRPDQADIREDAASASFNAEPTATALFDSEGLVFHDARSEAASRLAIWQRIPLALTNHN